MAGNADGLGNFVDHPNIDYVEIEGIKLRDSIFIVYPQGSPNDRSEFIYNLKPIEGSKDIVFDYDRENLGISSTDVCGTYTVEDSRVLNIKEMHNWHLKGYIFKDDDSWRKFSDLTR